VPVDANHQANYHFVNWTGTAVTAGKVAAPSSASTTVTMDADYTLQANFTDTVNFADPNLKACVEAALGRKDPNATDMQALKALTCTNQGVSDLTGLEAALNLTSLDLRVNSIAGLSPLSGLIKLEVLKLDDNHIAGIENMTPLTQLKQLQLSGNPIGDFESFSHLINLQVLLLKGTNDTIGDIPQSWLGLKQLKIVDLRDNQGLHKSDPMIHRLHFEVCMPNGGGVLVDN
jgi:Leucine-rich repeat (LRR) protein